MDDSVKMLGTECYGTIVNETVINIELHMYENIVVGEQRSQASKLYGLE